VRSGAFDVVVANERDDDVAAPAVGVLEFVEAGNGEARTAFVDVAAAERGVDAAPVEGVLAFVGDVETLVDEVEIVAVLGGSAFAGGGDTDVAQAVDEDLVVVAVRDGSAFLDLPSGFAALDRDTAAAVVDGNTAPAVAVRDTAAPVVARDGALVVVVHVVAAPVDFDAGAFEPVCCSSYLMTKDFFGGRPKVQYFLPSS
jgi:hypothetical protein